MAWLLQHDSSQFSFVKLDMEPSCRELSPPVEYFQENNCLNLYGRLWWSAVDIDDRFWPRRARMKTERKALPHWLGFCSFWGVSESFRECVEALEPNVHEFRPVDVARKDGIPFEEQYYALNVRRLVPDLIDWEQTNAPFEESRGIRLVRSPQTLLNKYRITLRKSAIDGLHLWIPREAHRGMCMGVSDALYALLAERKLLKGISAFSASEV
jgi:hypothetical protein